MMLLWFSSLALAAPDRVASELSDVTGTDELRVLDSADLAAVLDGNNVHLIDLQTWEVSTVASGCTASGLALWEASDGTPTLAVGCSDGSISTLTWDGTDPSSVTSTDLFVGTIQGLEYGDGYLYAVASGTGNSVGWTIDPSDWSTLEGAEDGNDGNTLPNGSDPDHMAATSTHVLIAHGSNSISRILLGDGAVSDDGATSAPAGSYVHVATISSASSALLTDSSGEITRYQSSGVFSILLQDLDGPTCSAIDVDSAWVAVAETGVVSLWSWDSSSFAFSDTTTPLAEVDTSAYDGVERIAGVTDYLLAGTSGGLLVLTELSWVEITSSYDSVDADTTLTFTSDSAGDYSVTLGEDGAELASGTITADDSVTVDLAVADLSEGSNRIWVTLDDGGHDAVDVVVDTPTPAASITSVSGGDGVAYLTLAAHGASDVDDVEIYLGSSSWEVADWASQTLATYSVDAADGEDSDLVVTLTGLTNYTTYYVSARWAAGDSEGDWSDVVEATPVPSQFVTCEMRTDGECPTCSTSPGGALGLLGVLALVGLARRRRGVAAGLLALVVTAPSLAQAQELPATPSHVQEPGDYYLQNKTRTTEVRFGPSSIDAPEFDVAYDRLVTVHLDGGIQLARFVELNGGIGLSRPVGSALLDDGTASDEVSRGNFFPISAGLTFRLDPAMRLGKDFEPLDYGWYGMPIVPWVTVGATAWPYVERKGAFSATDPLASSTRTGGAPGTWYWAAGADILLDWMDPNRAALAEARWGIADTYFTIEYRKGAQLWGPIDFGGDTWTAGIKVDRR